MSSAVSSADYQFLSEKPSVITQSVNMPALFFLQAISQRSGEIVLLWNFHHSAFLNSHIQIILMYVINVSGMIICCPIICTGWHKIMTIHYGPAKGSFSVISLFYLALFHNDDLVIQFLAWGPFYFHIFSHLPITPQQLLSVFHIFRHLPLTRQLIQNSTSRNSMEVRYGQTSLHIGASPNLISFSYLSKSMNNKAAPIIHYLFTNKTLIITFNADSPTHQLILKTYTSSVHFYPCTQQIKEPMWSPNKAIVTTHTLLSLHDCVVSKLCFIWNG